MQIEFNIVELDKSQVKVSEKNLGFFEVDPFSYIKREKGFLRDTTLMQYKSDLGSTTHKPEDNLTETMVTFSILEMLDLIDA
jgi:hypothetical protein